MPIIVQFLFVQFAIIFCSIGTLMLLAPGRYPKVYDGFLRENVMRRQHTERDRILAIRTQGLIAVAAGAFFVLFVWALR
ncbi:MAG TPA: hypothetical protein VE054_14090 [Blattabacteriaceae bacterium]|jgi:hypothetical protein|nr:hypothetical protein [Blattabacteriaceae bacterium]